MSVLWLRLHTLIIIKSKSTRLNYQWGGRILVCVCTVALSPDWERGSNPRHIGMEYIHTPLVSKLSWN